MRELLQGEVVDGFVVKQRLGQGGMGAVYLVHDRQLDVDRALKIVALRGPGFIGSDAEAREYRARFERETKTLARLRHKNILPIHGTGELEGRPYLVMTYFPSRDGRTFFRDENLDLRRVRYIASQVASALAHAHDQGVLHRDIKLGNLLIGADDETMLNDFGLAKSASDADLTRTGRTMGTFAYLAPEYVRESMTGKPTHTTATDLWALGCLFYALVCGEPAFRERNEIHLLRLIANADFVPVKTKAPSIPDAWAALIHSLLEPDVARRTKSAHEVVAALERIDLDGGAPSPPLPEPVAIAVQHQAAAAAGSARLEQLHSPSPPLLTENIDIDIVVADPDESSIMRHTDALLRAPPPTPGDDDDPPTGDLTADVAQPSFEVPAGNAEAEKRSAKRKLIVPLVASLSVLVSGAALILFVGHVAAAKHEKRTNYVDPETVEREHRGQQEVDDIERERKAREASERDDTTEAAFTPLPHQPPPVRPAAPQTPHLHRVPSTAGRAPAVAASAAASDPWTRRYGTRTTFNTSPIDPPTTTAAPVQPAKAAVAGLRIPVHFNDIVASSPIGPVVAYLDSATMLGDVELPRGTEVHGRVTGSSGPRLLVDFAFAVSGAKRFDLKGSALGRDGRPGIPGQKNVGNGSDVGAAAAAGAAQALVNAVAAVVPSDIARGALIGAESRITDKASRLDNEEELVVTERGVHFFVYVQSAT